MQKPYIYRRHKSEDTEVSWRCCNKEKALFLIKNASVSQSDFLRILLRLTNK